MNFGNQPTFDYVRNMISKPNSEVYYPYVYKIVRGDCACLLSRVNLPLEDKEDIIQDVQLSLFPKLVWYVENFADSSEAQRNACLKTILNRRLNDFLARKYKHKGVTSYDVEDFPMELCGVQDTMLSSMSNRDEVQQALRQVCSMDMPPQQTIAFLYAKSTTLLAKGGKNSKPALVAKALEGLPLEEAARIAIQQMREACPFPLEANVFAPLLCRIAQPTNGVAIGDLTFHLTPQAISYSCSHISEKLRKLRST